MPELTVSTESWPLAGAFAISRGVKTTAEVVLVTISGDGFAGRGECVPYTRYGESVEGVVAALEALAPAVASGLERDELQRILPAGAARNALDCALWDIEAKRTGTPVWRLAGLDEPAPLVTAYTLSLDTPEAMGQAARAAARRPLIKLKLAGEGDLERVAAVRENASESRLIVDANEGWSPDMVEPFSAALAELGVEMIEQPLPVEGDDALARLAHPLPFCADESCHDRTSLAAIAGRYEYINIKLDKAGGLTEALVLRREAREAGLRVMVGCMVATSLAMAPACLVAQGADIVDLDGPLWMARDREHGLAFTDSELAPPERKLWG